MLMDRAYEGDPVREKVREKGFTAVVPPKGNRREPWPYDTALYRQRNKIERFFRRLKRFRKIFTRYDKLDVIFSGLIYFVMCVDAVISVNRL